MYKINNSSLARMYENTLYNSNKFNDDCLSGRFVVYLLEEVIMSIARRPSCVTELIIGKLFYSCEQIFITGLRSLVLMRTPNHWVYSASELCKVNLNCYEDSGNINVTTISLSGVGVISEAYKPDVISDEFKVPARKYSSNTQVCHISKVVVSKTDSKSMLSGEDTRLINIDVNATLEILDGLDSELGTVDMQNTLWEGHFSVCGPTTNLGIKHKEWV